MKNTLRHEPARFGGKPLEAIKLVGRALGFGAGKIFHRIGRPVTVARPAQNTPAAAFFEPFPVKPLLHSFEPDGFFDLGFHGNPAAEKILRSKLITSKKLLSNQRYLLGPSGMVEFAQQRGEFLLFWFVERGKYLQDA